MNFVQVAQAFNPFMTKEGEIFIEVQLEGKGRPEHIALDTPLGRKIVRSVISPLFPKGYANDRETRASMEIIEALAFTKERKPAEPNVEQEVSRKPLAKAILAVARKGGTTKELTPLLAMLNQTAQREGIDTRKGTWPPTVDALGKQLSLLVDLMSKMGVQLTRNSTERPRTWSISPLPEESGGRDGNVTDVTRCPTSSFADTDTSAPSASPSDRITDDEIRKWLEECQ